jgi:preprotein translocase subunit SecE
VGAFITELVHAGIYKRSQGRITRQLTFAAMVIAIALGAWRLHSILKISWESTLQSVWLGWLAPFVPGFQYWFPGAILALGLWISYRIVNVPSFADFLIAVEAEMNKVSWPTRSELFRASVVVLIVIFLLAMLLAVFDVFWRFVFSNLLRLF